MNKFKATKLLYKFFGGNVRVSDTKREALVSLSANMKSSEFSQLAPES